MAIQTLSDLKAFIQQTIKDNNSNSIQGNDVQDALINAIDTLDSMQGFVNVHKANGQTTIIAYGSKDAARAAVPTDAHFEGVVIAYKLSTGWIIEQNLDATAGTWADNASWQTIGPVSVSQNTETEKTTINVAGISYSVATKETKVDDTILLVGGIAEGFLNSHHLLSDEYDFTPWTAIVEENCKLLCDIPAGTTIKFQIESKYLGWCDVKIRNQNNTLLTLLSLNGTAVNEQHTVVLTENVKSVFITTSSGATSGAGYVKFHILYDFKDKEILNQIKGFILAEAYTVNSVTRDSDGDVSSAVITWNDGTSGTISVTRNTLKSVTRADYGYGSNTYRLTINRNSNDDVTSSTLVKL